MNNEGYVHYQIKDEDRKAYRKAVAKSGVSESDFNRIAVGRLIEDVKKNGSLIR